VLIVLTLATLCMHGYHPLAEDGGLYAAGIEYLLDPTLFPHYTAFVQEHLRFSLFAPAVASVVRYSHLSMLWCLFLLNLLSIWFTLFSALQIVRRMTQPTQTMSDGVQAAAVALFAAWLCHSAKFFYALHVAGDGVCARLVICSTSFSKIYFAKIPTPFAEHTGEDRMLPCRGGYDAPFDGSVCSGLRRHDRLLAHKVFAQAERARDRALLGAASGGCA
jgi:hypothetical protein